MVTYHGNGNSGGSVPSDTNDFVRGDTVTVPSNCGNLVRSGYVFGGWNTQADGGGTHFNPTDTFQIDDSNFDLHAVWTQNPTYTVTNHANGADSGSVPTDGNNYEEGQNVTVLGNTGTLIRSGYGLIGSRVLDEHANSL